MPRKAAIPTDTWEHHRSHILNYYLEDRKPLKEVIELMKGNHGFIASREQYLRQFSKWNVQKYLNSHTWNQINRSIQGRQLNLNECEVHAQGYLVPNKKLKKELSRHVSIIPQITVPTTTPTTTTHYSIRGSSTVNSVSKVKFSNLPFLEFLCRSAPIFRFYEDAIDISDAQQLFCVDQTLNPVRESELDTSASHLVNEITLLEPYTSRSSSPPFPNREMGLEMMESFVPRPQSPSFVEFEIDLNFSSKKQQILQPQHLLMQSPKEHFLELKAKIEEFCSLLKISKMAGALQHLSPADKSLDFWFEGSSQEIAGKLSQEYSANVQFNFMKFVIYVNNSRFHVLRKELSDYFFTWITYNHLYDMIKRLFSLDIPTLHIFALKAFESKAFLHDPTLVAITLNTISKFIDLGQIADFLLIKAAESTNVSTIQYIIKAVANLNYELCNKDTLDLALSRSHNSKIAKILIDAGAEPKPYALQIAAYRGNCEYAKILLEAGCDGSIHLTPATSIGEAVMELSSKERLRWCSTPIQIASVMGHKAMVQLLLPYTRDLGKVNPKAHKDYQLDFGPGIIETLDGFTSGLFLDPLKLAIVEGHSGIVRILLQNGADPNTPRLINTGISLRDSKCRIEPCVRGRSVLIVRQFFLLEPIDLLDTIDYARLSHATALQLAIYFNTFDPEILLRHGADLNHQSPSGTALQFAAEKGNLGLVQSFLHSGAQINEACPSTGKTALQHGAGTDNLELALWLIGQGAEVNAAPAYFRGRSALQSACEKSNIEMVKLLLRFGAEVNCPASPWFGVTALQAAARSGKFDIVELLLARDADVGARGAVMVGGQTALEAAVKGGHVQVVRRLINAGADVNDTVSIQIPPLGEPTDDKWQIQFEAESESLLRCACTLKIDDEVSATAVQLAARRGSREILDILLENGADVNGPVAPAYEVLLELNDLGICERLIVDQGISTIHEALICRDMEMVNKILDTGSIELSAQLEFACSFAGLENFADILNRVDLNLVSTERLSLMMNWLLNKNRWHYDSLVVGICEILLNAGAKPEAGVLSWCLHCPPSFCRRLIRHGANPNGARERLTPLCSAASYDHIEFAELLLEAGADPNKHGIKPLHCLKSLAMTKLLLSWGADANLVSRSSLRLNGGETPLQCYAMDGELMIVAALIEAGANPAARVSTRPNYTALHFAARGGHLDTAALLIEHDSEVDSLAERCETAANEADVNGHVVLGEWLRKEASKRRNIVTEQF